QNPATSPNAIQVDSFPMSIIQTTYPPFAVCMNSVAEQCNCCFHVAAANIFVFARVSLCLSQRGRCGAFCVSVPVGPSYAESRAGKPLWAAVSHRGATY